MKKIALLGFALMAQGYAMQGSNEAYERLQPRYQTTSHHYVPAQKESGVFPRFKESKFRKKSIEISERDPYQPVYNHIMPEHSDFHMKEKLGNEFQRERLRRVERNHEAQEFEFANQLNSMQLFKTFFEGKDEFYKEKLRLEREDALVHKESAEKLETIIRKLELENQKQAHEFELERNKMKHEHYLENQALRNELARRLHEEEIKNTELEFRMQVNQENKEELGKEKK